MQTVAAINYDIPDDLHRRAKSAAALEGMSLKAFLEAALEQAVKRKQKRDELITSADALGDYLVGLSKVDKRIMGDDRLHVLVEDLYRAVVLAKEGK